MRRKIFKNIFSEIFLKFLKIFWKRVWPDWKGSGLGAHGTERTKQSLIHFPTEEIKKKHEEKEEKKRAKGPQWRQDSSANKKKKINYRFTTVDELKQSGTMNNSSFSRKMIWPKSKLDRSYSSNYSNRIREKASIFSVLKSVWIYLDLVISLRTSVTLGTKFLACGRIVQNLLKSNLP